MATENELNSLVLKRGQLKAQITRFHTFLDSFSGEKDNTVELETRLSRIENILDTYDDIQNQIESASGFKLQESERNTFEESYYTVIARARSFQDKFKSPADVNVVRNDANKHVANQMSQVGDFFNVASKIKLPSISLPDFHGLYSQWMTFHDSFNTLIHSNQQLSDIQKFYYLQSCLKDEAAQLIQSLEISNLNYEIAWSMLKERYENKRLIINTHMKAIFDLVPVKYESHIHLRKLLANFNKNFRALTALGQPTTTWNTPMVYTISSKLDSASKKEWEQHISKFEVDNITIKELTDFLAKRCQLLETIENKTKTDIKPACSNKSLMHLTTRKVTCTFCKKNHFNQYCDYFLKLTATSRLNEAKKLKLCLNCLRPGHFARDCKCSSCKTCGKGHNTLLHLNAGENIQPESRISDSATNNIGTNVTPTTSITMNAIHDKPTTTQILLATAMVNILDGYGNKVSCRALLDSGSQSNFVSSSLIERLKVKVKQTRIPVAGINNLLNNISKKSDLVMCSTDNRYQTKDTFLVVDKITENLPQISFDISTLNLPLNIQFADPYFNEAKPIDLLLGANVFYDLLCIGQIKCGKNNPIVQKTKLGWILSGPITSLRQDFNTVCNLTISNLDLHNQVKAFWELEEIGERKHYTSEETECEQHFVQTFQRDEHGRFELQLPLKSNIQNLGDSKEIALQRYLSLEKRLQRDETFKTLYIDFMEEYQSLGHMTEVNDSLETDTTKYYLPHHGILKDSTTTKLRVVFDASCKTTTGLSLNDVLKIGPTIQSDLFSIVLRFRKHNIVFIADIEKMYRQCNISDNHRDLQRILWRADSSQEIRNLN